MFVCGEVEYCLLTKNLFLSISGEAICGKLLTIVYNDIFIIFAKNEVIL